VTNKERVHDESENLVSKNEQSDGESDVDSVDKSIVIDSERQLLT